MIDNQLPVEDLVPNPENPRRDIVRDPEFAGLVASIRSEGMIQPILIDEDNIILAGHRRWEAARLLGLRSVPVRVLRNQDAPWLVPLIENLQRSDLGVLEAADYFLKCQRKYEMSITEIAEATGISASTITKYIKLAEAPLAVRERVDKDEIPLNAAFELLRHDDEFIQEVISEPLLTREIVRERAQQREPVATVITAETADDKILQQGNSSTLERIYNRVESGCYTPDAIRHCDECGTTLFPSLTNDDIRVYLERLVEAGRAEWRKEGGKKDMQRGSMTMLCVPVGTPTGAIDFTDRDRLSRGNEYADL
jgi:ParB family transcriptional regulator, chromosome partitioning protein